MRRRLVLVVLLLAPTLADAQGDVEADVLVADAPFPTAVEPLPGGGFLLTDRCGGRILVADDDGRLEDAPFARVADVACEGETGLLDVLHREDGERAWVYAFAHVRLEGGVEGRVLRWPVAPGEAPPRADGPAEVVVDDLPTGEFHNGGRIGFGPLDGMLYVTLGENNERMAAQDPDDPRGSLLRYTPDGGVPEDNPFGAENPVFAIGLRNPFGLAFDREGRAWVTENGLNDADEILLVEAGSNHGWPHCEGPCRPAEPGYRDPDFTVRPVAGPTGAAFGGRAFYWGGIVDREVRRMPLDGDTGRVLPRADVLWTAPSPVLDVAVLADGRLLVATTDAVHRIVDPRGAPPPAPPSPEPEPEPEPAPEPDPEPEPEPSPQEAAPPAGAAFAVAAAAVALLALALVLVARRRGR